MTPDIDTQLDLLQLRVRTNDELNELCRERIDGIFGVCTEYQESGERADPSNGKIGPHVNTGAVKDGAASSTKAITFKDEMAKLFKDSNDEIPSYSPVAVKSLALQLSKLKMQNMARKINSQNWLIQETKRKIGKLEADVSQIKGRIASANELENAKATIEREYEALNKRLANQLNDVEAFKITQVTQHCLKQKLKHLSLLQELVFSKVGSKELLFKSQSILPLNKFLTTNIILINQFLENLIILQYQLHKIFNFRLPYLSELTNYLPSFEFFNLIKEKEIKMFGRDEDEELEQPMATPIVDNERIIKLGNMIKLPLSSTTINNQRRKSFARTDTNSIQGTPPFEETSNSPPATNATATASTTTTTTGMGAGASQINKKMIIIPHKILNKPFNKLSIKEFLKFLLIIVKILFNFKVFFVLNHEDNYSVDKFYDFDEILLRLHRLKVKQNPSVVMPSDDNLKTSMDQVYNRLINEEMSVPSSLRDLNVSSLIENQVKIKMEWDIVSRHL